MLWIYRLLFLPALVVIAPIYLRRMWRRGGYRGGFTQRFGGHRRVDLLMHGRRAIPKAIEMAVPRVERRVAIAVTGFVDVLIGARRKQ